MQADAFICIERELVSDHIEEDAGRYVQTVRRLLLTKEKHLISSSQVVEEGLGVSYLP